MRKLVYICHPLAGDEDGNREEVRQICACLDLSEVLPVAPHLLFTFINETTDRARALELGIELMLRCDEVWVFGSRISDGMRQEINLALEQRMVLRFLK